jgi:hypothetical protein
MRHLKYLILLAAVIAIPAAYSNAQVSFGVGVQIGPDYGYYNPPPVCPYGYYPDYPFGCAPYGYWGPEWFVDGVFIGAGPWYHFYYSHPDFYRGYYAHRFYGDRDRRDFWRRGGWDHDRGFRGEERGFRGGDFHDRGFRGGDRAFNGGNGFRGGDRGREGDRGFRGNGFRGGDGGRGVHGGGESHGGGRGEFRGGGHEGGGHRDGGGHGDHGHDGGHDHGRR